MKIIKRLKRSIYKRLVSYKLVKPKVIVQMDGGVCSQMHQYILGYLFMQKGYKVYFDLSFFTEWGLDLNNKFVRKFDLLKAFPYLNFNKASEIEIYAYRKKVFNKGNHTPETMTDFSFLEKKPPIFLGDYYHLPPTIWLPAFQSLYKMDNTILDDKNNKVCHKINSRPNSVAVHVRRGDLSVEVYAYGKPATFNYFQKAISHCQSKLDNPYFFFFSDEPEWVQNELIPRLCLIEQSEVISINGSDKGYMDLYLIAHCKNQITTKGTLGKYGALLNDNPSKIVIFCDDKTEYYWKDIFKNPTFL